MPALNKSEYKAYVECVGAALRYWDPIGVFSHLDTPDWPLDEYDSYAPQILSAIIGGESSNSIAVRLATIRSERMAIGPARPDPKEMQLSKKLVEWREEDYPAIANWSDERNSV